MPKDADQEYEEPRPDDAQEEREVFMVDSFTVGWRRAQLEKFSHLKEVI